MGAGGPEDAGSDLSNEIDHSRRPRADKCYGLALSDSHSLGPYQAGVIKGLVHEMRATTQGEYEVVSGVAMGALNAHILSQFDRGQE